MMSEQPNTIGWIEARDGTLVNLQNVQCIYIAGEDDNGKGYQIIADYNLVDPEDDDLRYTILSTLGSLEAAEECMAVIRANLNLVLTLKSNVREIE